jgi:hypothetical protein
MDSRVFGIKKGTKDELVVGMPVVINGDIAIIPESSIEKSPVKNHEVTITAVFVKESSFQFIPF